MLFRKTSTSERDNYVYRQLLRIWIRLRMAVWNITCGIEEIGIKVRRKFQQNKNFVRVSCESKIS